MTRSSLLALMQIEIENLGMDEVRPPIADMKPDERSLGIVSDDLKKVYTLWQTGQYNFDLAVVQCRHARTEAEHSVLSKGVHELHIRAELWRKLFWASLACQFDDWEGVLGIRSRWEAVKLEESGDQDGHPDIINFLRKLMDSE